MSRLKFPPYGREIQNSRAAREPVDRVWCWLTATGAWPEPGPLRPAFIVPMLDYAPGVFDFRFCAGLPVFVVDDERVKHEARCALLAEVASIAAIVQLVEARGREIISNDVSEVLFAARRSQEDGLVHWPAGWSDQLDHDYQQRRAKYLDFERTYLAA